MIAKKAYARMKIRVLLPLLSVLHTSQSAEPHGALNDMTDLHSGSSFPSPYSWVTKSSQSGNLSRPHSE